MEKKRPVGIMIISVVMFIFGLLSVYFGVNLFRGYSWLELHYRIAQILILICGLIYCISSIFIFGLKRWARSLAVSCSVILLFCFVPLVLLLIGIDSLSLIYGKTSCGVGWGYSMSLMFSPFIIFPLIFIYILNRPKVKEQFK